MSAASHSVRSPGDHLALVHGSCTDLTVIARLVHCYGTHVALLLHCNGTESVRPLPVFPFNHPRIVPAPRAQFSRSLAAQEYRQSCALLLGGYWAEGFKRSRLESPAAGNEKSGAAVANLASFQSTFRSQQMELAQGAITCGRTECPTFTQAECKTMRTWIPGTPLSQDIRETPSAFGLPLSSWSKRRKL